jgi:copper resistance protein C
MHRMGFLAAAACLVGQAALAHAQLQRASPRSGSKLAVPPSAVTITYTEDVEPALSTIEVLDVQGTRVDKSDPHLVGNGNRQLSVSLLRLPPGRYSVIWHVTSVDTHKTEGQFNFSVSP